MSTSCGICGRILHQKDESFSKFSFNRYQGTVGETKTSNASKIVSNVNTSTLYGQFENKSRLPKSETLLTTKKINAQNVSHQKTVDPPTELKRAWSSRFGFLSADPALLSLVTGQTRPDTSVTQEAFVLMHTAFEHLGRDGWLTTDIDTAASVMWARSNGVLFMLNQIDDLAFIEAASTRYEQTVQGRRLRSIQHG